MSATPNSSVFLEGEPQGWSVTGVHHVAFAHEDESIFLALHSLLGLSPTHELLAPGFIERMVPLSGCSLQLLQSSGDGVVQSFLKRRGPGLHHVAFRVDDLDAALRDLNKRGAHLIDEAARSGGGGTRIAFIHPRQAAGLLVELVDAPS
ncbi:MAG: VOC family protein [Acidimicrobiales bacterium]